ncbi:hypothetical protein ACFL57_03945, partial [Candidatus Margulisiibacteriota bacterium]
TSPDSLKYYDAETAQWYILNESGVSYTGTLWNQNGTALYYTTGNVGIGTTAPESHLHIVDPSSYASLILDAQNDASFSGIRFEENGTPAAWVQFINSNYGTSARRNNLEIYNEIASGGITFHTDSSIPDVTIKSDGNVGIGTTDPISPLHIKNGNEGIEIEPAVAANQGRILFYDRSDSTFNKGSFDGLDHTFRTSGNDKMFLSNAGGLSFGNSYTGTDAGAGNMIITGKVGIGTTAPSAKLTIKDGNMYADFIPDQTYGFKMLQTYTSALPMVVGGSGDVEVVLDYNNNDPDITVFKVGKNAESSGETNYAELLRVQEDGKVGIGTTAPGKTLEIFSTQNAHVRIARSGSNYWDIGMDNGSGMLDFKYAGADKLRLDYSAGDLILPAGDLIVEGTGDSSIAGSLGIGTTNPVNNLHIHAASGYDIFRMTNAGTGATSGDGVVMCHATSGSSNFDFWNYESGFIRFGTNNQPRVIIQSNGNVGIGTDAPNAELEVIGTVSANAYITAGVPADYVFEADYDLKTIEEQAAFMWANKHLPAIKGAEELGGQINIAERLEQTVEELEKAHVYIEQLNKSDMAKDREILELKAENELIIERINALEAK